MFGNWKMGGNNLSFDHQAYADKKNSNSILMTMLKLKMAEQNKVPTLGLGVIENGALTQVKVFGEIAKGVPATLQYYFNVASLTKPVTAIVALKLVSLGKWNLDEAVYKYWTDPIYQRPTK
jgi:CubicO group peptidase (beta-lactamase class C family)